MFADYVGQTVKYFINILEIIEEEIEKTKKIILVMQMIPIIEYKEV